MRSNRLDRLRKKRCAFSFFQGYFTFAGVQLSGISHLPVHDFQHSVVLTVLKCMSHKKNTSTYSCYAAFVLSSFLLQVFVSTSVLVNCECLKRPADWSLHVLAAHSMHEKGMLYISAIIIMSAKYNKFPWQQITGASATQCQKETRAACVQRTME
jgi:hypothetical protein